MYESQINWNIYLHVINFNYYSRYRTENKHPHEVNSPLSHNNKWMKTFNLIIVDGASLKIIR